MNLTKYEDDELIALSNGNINEELKKRGYIFGWHKKTEYAGVIYVLVNPAFPDYVKIGYADDINKRLKTLNRSSALPDPFHVYATYAVKSRLEDLRLHKLIDSLDPDLRHNVSREFYEMSPEKAFSILAAIAEINGDMDLLIKNPLNDSYFAAENSMSKDATVTGNEDKKTIKGPLKFSEIGIPIGSELVFLEDHNIRCVTNSDDTVLFEGASWKLSPLVREIKRRNGTCNKSGAYQGGLYFLYKGVRLTDLRNGK